MGQDSSSQPRLLGLPGVYSCWLSSEEKRLTQKLWQAETKASNELSTHTFEILLLEREPIMENEAQTQDSWKTRTAEAPVLAKELLEHLSKEIQSQSEQMMTFRTRVTFLVWVGPFIIAGSYLLAVKAVPQSFSPDKIGVACLVVAAILYIVLAEVFARLEAHVWDQCNVWRSSIRELAANPSFIPPEDHVVFTHGLREGYRALTWLILALFSLLAIGGWRVTHN
jgi:hypothetical protein